MLEVPSVPQSEADIYNYCHDQEIRDYAESLGITDRQVINNLLSIGESGYSGGEVAIDELDKYAQRQRIQPNNKYRNNRSALSRNQKREILRRNGITY